MGAVFHRKTIALDFARKILLDAPASSTSSGLFLAAPRRTGKSTFLREDLRPELEAQGALVIYADLWENRKADPGHVIAAAVRQEMNKHEGVIARLAKAAGVDRVNVGGLSFALEKTGLNQGVSLVAAFSALSDETRKMIVVIVDEAQHAITTESGNEALFGLKAARDELNSSRHFGLRVVATGSNQDKLAMLRAGRDQAFFGAPLVRFPSLSKDYVEWFCEHASLPGPLDPAKTFALFKKAAYRPEILGAAADALRFDLELVPSQVMKKFTRAVNQEIDAGSRETLRVIRSLTPLQSAVLRVVAARGGDYAPFDAATISAYAMVLSVTEPGGDTKADVPNIQNALSMLQEKSLVWKASRGVYSLEESSLADLMREEGLLDMVPAAGPQKRGAEKG